MRTLKKMGNIWKLLMAAFVFLSSSAYAQGVNPTAYIKNNPNGSQTLLNHVPEVVALGLAKKTGSANSNQMLDLRILIPSKNQAGLDSFIQELYDPQSPNYHKFLTPDQYALLYGASTIDSSIVSQYLKSQGLIVTGQSSNGRVLSVTGAVSKVQSAFKVNISNYQGTDGKSFFAPDINPTIPAQVAGQIYAIIGMDNVVKLHPLYFRLNRLGVNNAKGSLIGGSLSATPVTATNALTATTSLNGNILSKRALKPLISPPAAPQGLTATPSDNYVILNWETSATAVSYNVYRATLGGSFTEITSVTTTTYTDYPSPSGLTNGTTYEYKVTAVNTGGEGGFSSQVSAVPFAFLGIGGSMGPSDIADAYNLNSVTSNGSGQTLGVFELDGYLASDITTFEDYYRLPNVTLNNVYTDSYNGAAGFNTDEVVLDIELEIAVAPGVSSIRVYEAPDSDAGWVDQYDTIVKDANRPNVVSISWAANEYDGGYNATIDTYLSELAGLGVTVFSAAGDSGAYGNCDNGTNPPNCTTSDSSPELTVVFPASDKYVTGVGISILKANNPGTISESYNSEEASLYGGGGVSTHVSIPSFQTAAAAHADNPTAMVSTTNRNVPDVVFTADIATAYGIYVTDPFAGAGWYGFGGSSAASPIWAAFMSRVNQGRVAAGLSVIGWLNPAIYAIAQSSDYTNDFHDISTGINDNFSNFSGNDYYPAEAGFDDASGLGSFNGANLYNELVGPAAPTGLTPTPGNGNVMLNWTASSGAASYNVKRATVHGGPYTTISTSGTVTSTNYTDSTVTNGQEYFYVVSAVNAGEIEGANSSEVNATPLAPTVPTPPNVVSAVSGPANPQATVTFSGALANGSAITSYTVTSSPGGLTGTGASSPIIISGLTDGTSYTFTVVATNGIGPSPASAPSNSVIAGTPTPPTTVTAVYGDTSAQVTFSGSSPIGGPITGYTVTSIPAGGSNSGTSSPITVSGLTNGTTYTFTVAAGNLYGTGTSSAPSNSVTPAGPPFPPTTVTAAPGNSAASVSFSGALPNGSVITGYTVTSSPGGFTGAGASSPITVPGLTNGTAYTFTVVATNMVGPGSASVASNSIIAGVPLPPTTVTAVSGNAQATVSFSGATANGSPINLYTVISSPAGGLTNTGASSPITVTGLTNGTPYTFTVTATNTFGTSPSSASSNSATPTPVMSPTNLNATILGARVGGGVIYGGVVLTWGQSISPNVVQNNIYRSTGSGSFSLLATINASTSYTDKNVIKGAIYNYEVTAVNASLAESNPSGVVTLNY